MTAGSATPRTGGAFPGAEVSHIRSNPSPSNWEACDDEIARMFVKKIQCNTRLCKKARKSALNFFSERDVIYGSAASEKATRLAGHRCVAFSLAPLHRSHRVRKRS